MLSNDTVVELLEGRNVEVGAVGHFACASGASCALVILHHKEDLNKSAHITVDYSSQKVIRIQHTDGW
jgi:diaminopimelate epimerase